MMARFRGKTTIVTGATAGIGEAVARRLADEGARLVLVARGTQGADSLVAELGEERATFVAGSVTDPATADEAVAAARRSGGADVLVNNAGIDFTSDLLDTAQEDVRRVFETNFFGALWMLLHVGREMRVRGGGAIVNVTSRLASIGVPTMAIYSASKGALLALTRAAAVELAPMGIRVNAVAPGLTATPLVDEWLRSQPDSERFAAEVVATIPQGRFATPEEVAAAVAYLAADEAGHVTGATLAVDGGYTAT
jgi:NAD(P)-dependent dehydrogenase (short-subunit alcohol dehydrogenase family)